MKWIYPAIICVLLFGCAETSNAIPGADNPALKTSTEIQPKSPSSTETPEGKSECIASIETQGFKDSDLAEVDVMKMLGGGR